MAGVFLYLVAMLMCIVQSALSAFSYVWHRRYAIASLQGNQFIGNKIIAIGCLVLAAGIMVFCTMHLPLTLYCCLTNGNMVLVTVFAYFILGERINRLQIAALVSLVLASVMTAIAVKPSLSNDFEDPLQQERKGKQSLLTAGTIAFLVTSCICFEKFEINPENK
jgi:drug/metabolite transporter (DMT)-like permease